MTDIEVAVQVLQEQRNVAMDTIVNLRMQIQKLQSELDELKNKEVQEEFPDIDKVIA